jgi:hypothetical protein
MNAEGEELDFAQPVRISGERRRHTRYELEMSLRYKIRNGVRVLEMGCGVTRNLSSGGVAFTADQLLPRGAVIELWIDWPTLLDSQHDAMQLTMTGQIVRSSESATAVRTFNREFRTAAHDKFTGTARAVPRALCQWSNGNQR